jgi:hypothetical protein
LSPLSRFPSIEPVEQILDVTAVEVAGIGDVEFSARKWRGVLEPLSDPTYFARVRVDPDAGTIAWPAGLIWLRSRCTRRGAAPS